MKNKRTEIHMEDFPIYFFLYTTDLRIRKTFGQYPIYICMKSNLTSILPSKEKNKILSVITSMPIGTNKKRYHRLYEIYSLVCERYFCFYLPQLV